MPLKQLKSTRNRFSWKTLLVMNIRSKLLYVACGMKTLKEVFFQWHNSPHKKLSSVNFLGILVKYVEPSTFLLDTLVGVGTIILLPNNYLSGIKMTIANTSISTMNHVTDSRTHFGAKDGLERSDSIFSKWRTCFCQLRAGVRSPIQPKYW